MSGTKPLTLGDVLANPTHPGREVMLFLPRDANWTLRTPALVTDLDDGMEEPEDIEARTGFVYVLGLGDVGQIVTNARMQLPRVTPLELLRAFFYYLDRDAFIDFSAEPDQAS